jgi:hypothetical protein
MKSNIPCLTTLIMFLLGNSILLSAESTIDPVAKSTTKVQVTQSLAGFRDTLMFYTFPAEKAVLTFRIDNQNDQFAIKSASLKIFKSDATADGISNWINNQHSCGLFPEVPEPVTTHDIPASAYSVISKKIAEAVVAQTGPENQGKLNRYEVEFKIQKIPALGEFKIKDFTDTASVYVKAN